MKRAALFSAGLLAVFLAAAPAFAEKVKHVIDGDTFILANNQRVRMIGIDAPEVTHRRFGKRGEPFGNQARDRLAELIEGKDVRLEGDHEEFDRYGRRLSYVYLQDGTFVNRKMIEEGLAEVYRRFTFRHRDDFLAAEEKARGEGVALWNNAPPSWADTFQRWLEDMGWAR